MMDGMAETQPNTIAELLAATVARVGDRQALGTVVEGQLSWRTWSEVIDDVRRFAERLQQEGIGSGDRVAQWAPNSYEWIVVDLALLLLGAVHVPLHASLAESQVAELLELAEPKLLIVGDDPRLEGCFAGEPGRVLGYSELNVSREKPSPQQTMNMASLEGKGNVVDGHGDLEIGTVAGQLATLLFTSGTTGQPRGVMLSHENLVSNAIAVSEAVGSDANETRVCFLPLSHIYARTCDLYSWLYRGSKLVLAESRDTIVRDCQLAKPTVINGVPYFYQKIAQQLGDAQPGALRKLFGGELKRCFCGGAAIAPEVEQAFERQGLPILSGYGLTEASPVISATGHDDYRPGTVGRPMANLQVKLSSAGEILVRGPSVMQGYWNDPAATDEALVDGWLHTGDLGVFDEAGHLRIVGRQKELIVLSTGKNVVPSRVEQHLAGSTLIEHVCVVGDGQKCLGALIVPNPEALRSEIKRLRLWVWSRRRAVSHPKVCELYRNELDRLLAPLSSEEQVGCFHVLDRNFAIERGELTAKLSLRREAIATNFGREIEQMYAR